MIDERSDEDDMNTWIEEIEARCVRAVVILSKFAGMSIDDFLDRVFEDHDE